MVLIRCVPIFCLCLILALPVGVMAQSEPVQNSISMSQALPKLNRIAPLQNPKLAKAESVFDRAVIDRTNRIVGTVQDVRVSPDGNVEALRVAFDSLRLAQPVDVAYASVDITPSSNGYKIGWSGDEVASLYPELLSGIETAAGTSVSALPSLRAMIGVDVFDPQQHKVAQVADVILNEQRTRLEGLYLVMDGARDAGVAVPFSALAWAETNGSVRATISDQDLQTLLRYLEN